MVELGFKFGTLWLYSLSLFHAGICVLGREGAREEERERERRREGRREGGKLWMRQQCSHLRGSTASSLFPCDVELSKEGAGVGAWRVM